MKPKAIVVFGNSGSGKDTVSKMLCMMDDRLHHMRFCDPAKREVENEMGLPTGLIEHRIVKQAGALDRLIALYHERKDEPIVPLRTRLDLKTITEFGLIPVFSDCRNNREHELLKEYDVLAIWVETERGKMLSTDKLQKEFYDSYPNNDRIYNYYGLTELMDEVTCVYSRSIKNWL